MHHEPAQSAKIEDSFSQRIEAQQCERNLKFEDVAQAEAGEPGNQWSAHPRVAAPDDLFTFENNYNSLNSLRVLQNYYPSDNPDVPDL